MAQTADQKRTTATKVKKGWLAVRVGLGDDEGGFRRFTIPISYLYHPQFARLLEAAQEAYGYQYSSGPLKLPCSVDDFLQLQWLIDRESSHTPHGSHHRPLLHHSSLSLYSR